MCPCNLSSSTARRTTTAASPAAGSIALPESSRPRASRDGGTFELRRLPDPETAAARGARAGRAAVKLPASLKTLAGARVRAHGREPLTAGNCVVRLVGLHNQALGGRA
jgi:hypothetical protein